ncbi:TSA1-like protein [Cucumis melo var. makuwa]|uniref:TSA1-like protein n=1 Tax=Cucumis melo var. makuwa TaxID=1194695 RepID=A0A5D3E3G3_CUCMM|nr:TSA1-like protein [Cucumis melo var. makuwa]
MCSRCCYFYQEQQDRKEEEKFVQVGDGKEWTVDLTKETMMVIPKMSIKDYALTYFILNPLGINFHLYLETCEEVLVAKEVKMRKEIESKNKEHTVMKVLVAKDKIQVDSKGFGKWKKIIEESKEMESEI